MIKKNLRPCTEIAFVILLALPLVLYAWIGFYSRYVADDFWSAGYLRVLGFWEAQRYWYLSWSGRYSFTFLVSLMELLGVSVARWLPVSSLVLWTGALYWFWDGVFKLASLPYSRWIRLGASFLVIYTTLRTLVGWQQVLLWQTGLLTYTVPLIGLTFWAAWFLTRLNKPKTYTPRWYTLLSTVLFFWFLGGLSETSLEFQTVILGITSVFLGLLPKEYPHRRGALLLLAAGLVGSLAALLCVAIAPGNSVRLGQTGSIHLPQMTELAVQTFRFAQHYFKNFFTLSIRPVLCILGIPALFAIGFHPRLNQRPTRRDLLLPTGFLLIFLLVILGVYWVCFLPAYVAMRAGPPLRSIVIMFFWLSLTFSIESYVFGVTITKLAQWISPVFQRPDTSRLIRIGAVLALLVLLAIGPLQTAQKLWHIWPEYRQFAVEWDIRDRMARQAAANGIRDIVLPQLNDLYDLGPEAEEQFARYYGLLGSITFHSDNP
jgi:hypothetical protein